MTETLITVLRSRGRRLSKLIRADGSIAGYDRARTFDLAEVAISDLGALEALLRGLARRRECCVVRGAIADYARTRAVRRLLYPEGGDQPTLHETPRRWLALDFDDIDKPACIDHADLVGCASVAIQTLAPEFQTARFVVQATASHGLKRGIHLRIWFWLDRPVTGAELKYWLHKSPVDPSVFGAAHIIYTANPEIECGAFDPLTERLAVVPGNEAVIVPPPDHLKAPKPRARYRESEPAQDDDFDRLIRFVETAPVGNRNAALYWAARRVAEKNSDSECAAAILQDAAVNAGLSAAEAAATIRSGFRHG